MEPNTLILTVGLPRSGKSTWAMQQGCPVVNPDSIRLSLHGQPFIKEAEPLVWAIAHIMVDALFEAGHSKVILDATNTTRKRRAEWCDRPQQVVYEVFNTPMQVCIERAHEFGKPQLVPIIEAMASRWEAP